MEIEEIAKSYARGSVYIFAGRTISFLLSFIGAALIARILAREYGSSEPFGWLQVLLFLPQLTLFLGDLGIGYGFMNKCAKLLSNKDYLSMSQYVWSWVSFNFILNFIYSFITFTIGGWFIINLYAKPEVLPFVHLVAIGIICNLLFSIGQGIAVILDKTWILALSLILYSLMQALLAPLALLLGFKFYGLAFVYFVIMPLVASIPGLVLLFKNLPLEKPSWIKIKEMLKFGFPVAASAYTAIPSARAYEILISRFATSAQLGFYSVAQRLTPIIDVILYSISYLMFINYSKLNNRNDIDTALNFTIKIVSYFIAPIAIFTIFFSKQLIIALFGPFYSNGWFYLTLIAIYWLGYCLGGFAITTMLVAQGYSKENFKLAAIYSAISFIFNLILIPLLSITGAIISSIISGIPSYILSLKILKEKLKVNIKLKNVFKIIIISLFSIIPSYIFWIGLSYLIIFNIIEYYAILFLCILISGGIYILSTKRFNILKKTELEVIESGLKEMPFVGNIMGFIFNVYKRL